jgi:hypothetical protein
MKKLIFTGFTVLMIIGFALAGPASADVSWGNEGNSPVTLGSGSDGSATPAEYGLSKNVYLDYTVDTDHMNYELGSVHKSGNRGYGTSNVTTLIYYRSKDTGDTSVSMPGTPGTDHTYGTSWTAM